jgi:hypothetical protein
MGLSRAGFLFAIVSSLSLVVPSAYAAGLVLITPDEAKLPPPKVAVAMTARGVTRGPQIELVQERDPTKSPTHLQLKFQAHGGAKVDPSSVQMTYLRTPDVDLTARIKPFVTDAGIDLQDAVVPPGAHILRVDVKDSDGRAGTLSFVLNVAQ